MAFTPKVYKTTHPLASRIVKNRSIIPVIRFVVLPVYYLSKSRDHQSKTHVVRPIDANFPGRIATRVSDLSAVFAVHAVMTERFSAARAEENCDQDYLQTQVADAEGLTDP